MRLSLPALYASKKDRTSDGLNLLQTYGYSASAQVFSYLKHEYLELAKGISPPTPMPSNPKAPGSIITPIPAHPTTVSAGEKDKEVVQQYHSRMSTLHARNQEHILSTKSSSSSSSSTTSSGKDGQDIKTKLDSYSYSYLGSGFSPMEVQERMALLVSKIRILEDIITCIGSDQSVIFQHLILSSDDFVDRLLYELSLLSRYVHWYLRALLREEDPDDPGYSGSSAPNAARSTKLSHPHQVRKYTDLDDFSPTHAPNSPNSPNNPNNPPNALNHGISVAQALPYIDGESDQKKDATGPSPPKTLTNTQSSKFQSGETDIPTEFSSVWEVFDCREGHPVEEVARIEYICTILTLFHMLLAGSQALGRRRTSIISSQSFLRMKDTLYALLIIDPVSVSQVAKAKDSIDLHQAYIRRKHRYQYKEDYFSQKRGRVTISSDIDDQTKTQAYNVQQIDDLQEVEREMEMSVFHILRTKLDELCVQQACNLAVLFDVSTQFSLMNGTSTIFNQTTDPIFCTNFFEKHDLHSYKSQANVLSNHLNISFDQQVKQIVSPSWLADQLSDLQLFYQQSLPIVMKTLIRLIS